MYLFPESKRKGRELFALNVVGESMKDIGILDGDVVICEKKPVAEKWRNRSRNDRR